MERAARLRVLLLVLVVLAFVLHVAFAARDHVMDDAYISFRYARNLAAGRGLVFNPGEHVEGYTNFAWVLLSALSLAVGVSPVASMRALGALSGAALVVLAARAARRLAADDDGPREVPWWSGLPAALVVASSTSLAFYAGTGLETALFALTMGGAGFALAERRATAFAAWTGAAFLTRPDAGWLGLVGALVFANDARRAAPGARRETMRAGALLAGIVMPYLAFKLAYFGALLPNTAIAKPPSLAAGLAYLGPLLPELAGPALVAASVAVRARRLTKEGTLLALWAAQAVAVALVGGDWMPFARLLVPAIGWLAVAADSALVHHARASTSRAALAALLAATYLPLSLLDLKTVTRYESADVVDVFRAELVHLVRDSGVRSLATYDIGLVGWEAPDVTIVDLAGLTDRTIARSPGLHLAKEPDPAYLQAKDPDAYVVTARDAHGPGGERDVFGIHASYAPEGFVVRQPWFQRHYRHRGALEVSDHYYIHWFERARP